MAHVNARQWQRFVYRADVQLGWLSLPSERERTQAASSIDVSVGGIQLTAAEAPAIGASVSCRLAAGKRVLTLPGRVRWARPPARVGLGNTIGIEFGPLSQSELLSVTELVGDIEHAGEIVQVKLEAWREPLRAVAVDGEQGLRVRLALPWFRAGTVLRLESQQRGLALDGRVVNCRLHARAESRDLEIDLLLEPCAPARQRRYAIYETPADAAKPQAASRSSERPELRERRQTDARAPLVVPKTRANRVIAQLFAACCAGCLLFALTRATPQPMAAKRPRVQMPRLADDHATLITTMTSAPPAAHIEEAPKLDEHVAPPAAHAEPPAVHVEEAPKLDVHVSAPAPQDEAEPAPAPPPPPAAKAPDERAPELTVESDTTTVVIPIDGTATQLRTALWADPPAVAVDIPGGRVRLTHSRYDISAGGVTGVSVGRNNQGVTQVRVLLSSLLTSFDAKPIPGAVKFVLKRDLRPMSQGISNAAR